ANEAAASWPPMVTETGSTVREAGSAGVTTPAGTGGSTAPSPEQRRSGGCGYSLGQRNRNYPMGLNARQSGRSAAHCRRPSVTCKTRGCSAGDRGDDSLWRRWRGQNAQQWQVLPGSGSGHGDVGTYITLAWDGMTGAGRAPRFAKMPPMGLRPKLWRKQARAVGQAGSRGRTGIRISPALTLGAMPVWVFVV